MFECSMARHRYYSRSLHRAFYAKGENCCLAASLNRGPTCPSQIMYSSGSKQNSWAVPLRWIHCQVKVLFVSRDQFWSAGPLLTWWMVDVRSFPWAELRWLSYLDRWFDGRLNNSCWRWGYLELDIKHLTWWRYEGHVGTGITLYGL